MVSPQECYFRTGGLVCDMKLQLPSSMRIHPVVNVSWIVQYKKQIKEQKKEEGKPIEVEGIEKWEIEKILNKKKIRGVDKYLVQCKRFTAENDIWEKRENLENVEEALEKFEERMNVEVRRQKKIDMVEERDFRWGELPEKYIIKLLYGWDDKKFEDEYLKKLEKNWKRWKEDRQIDENKYLKRIEEREEEEEKEKMNERDWRTGHFSGGEILKRGNIKIAESKLCFFLFAFILIFFFIYFSSFLFLELWG